MAEPLVEFMVPGVPVPQGSKSITKTGVMFDQNAKVLRPWRKAVKEAAQAVWRDQGHPPVCVPVQATIAFVFPAVPSNPDRHWVAGRPDGDKLCRAIFDAMTDAELVADDALIVRHLASKRYADHGEPAGVHVAIESLADHERLASARRRNERKSRR